MDADERATLEAEIRRRFDAGDLDAAMTAAIGGYGGEIFGFLIGLCADRDRASDVFGATCERLWRGLPGFRWQSSFRVWAYTVARHEFLRAAERGNRARKEVPLSDAPALADAVQRVRTTTPAYQRTDVKDSLARVRAELAPEDHMLLGLRLDRQLAWNEIAEILGGNPPALRKRYERLKERLRALVRVVR